MSHQLLGPILIVTGMLLLGLVPWPGRRRGDQSAISRAHGTLGHLGRLAAGSPVCSDVLSRLRSLLLCQHPASVDGTMIR